jgi:hypothetical protein
VSALQAAPKEARERAGILVARQFEQQTRARPHVHPKAGRERTPTCSGSEVHPAGNAGGGDELKIQARPSFHLSNSTAATRMGNVLPESPSVRAVDGLHVPPDLPADE